MLTDEEIRALLAVAMGYDNRRPGDLNVAAWRTASDIGRWTLGEAIQAVHEHYAVSRDFLMPADITQRIRAERRHAPLPAERQLDVAPPAEPARIQAIVAEVAKRLGWRGRQTDGQNVAALTVECPHCHAGPKRPCTRLVTRGPHRGEYMPLRNLHPSRIELAEKLTGGQE
jgi:hypothetical protein